MGRKRTAAKKKAYGGIIVNMATIHISEADAAGDFAGLMARVRAGIEVVIESGAQPVAVLRAAAPPRRSISESIALAEARSKELGYKPVMDADFATDMEEIVRNRKPRDTSAWD
jgi:antitoxin (DNA-binding transcriptional repressor) of toxin-antitoxin stability system